MLFTSLTTDATPLRENLQEGYTCVTRSNPGCVYLPDTTPFSLNIDVQSTTDITFHPKTSANEILLTPVVSITSQSEMLSTEQPVIIELKKTTQLLNVGEYKAVPMFSDTDQSAPPNWKELGEECDVLEDRIRFKTTHFSYFTVIARFSPPAASRSIDPDADSLVQLTIPELPRFEVGIPSKSVQSSVEVKATLYYDNSTVCGDNSKQPLASACVVLEPHGQHFTEKISVQVPIPGYWKITDTNPNAKPQLLYSPTGASTDWVMHEDMEIDKAGEDVLAKFYVDHFSQWKIVWSQPVAGLVDAIGNIFRRVKSLGGRCQAFMTELGSAEKNAIQVVVYPFQDPPLPIPDNYHYTLLDSGKFPIEFSPEKLHFSITINDQVFSKPPVKFDGKFLARADFTVDELEVVPKEGILAQLSVDCLDDTSVKHEFPLIKVTVIIN